MSRDPNVAALVSDLVGHWTGHGRGEYPTIESFEYRESLTITDRPDHPALHFEQRAFRLTDDGEVVSHWETGLIRFSRDGSARLLNAQTGRAEALEGGFRKVEDGWRIELKSIGFVGDARVVTTRRSFLVTPESLEYSMHMRTTAVDKEHFHLRATLHRGGGTPLGGDL